MKNGATLIAEEREEHLSKHGRTVQRDVENNANGELLDGVRCLINEHPAVNSLPVKWRENSKTVAMLQKSHLDRLVIAGALIAAEIDRLQANNTEEDWAKGSDEAAVENDAKGERE